MSISDLFSKVSKTVSTASESSADSSKIVGIDIGSSSIKVVELQNRNNVLTLTTYGELELGPYQDEGPVGKAVNLVANIERQALVDILRESAVKSKQAVLSMPLHSSFVTIMSMLAPADEDISPRVRVEARKYIPVPIAEVTLDWAEVDSPAGQSDQVNTRDVLLAAIQNDALARFKGLLNTVSLANTPIEIECFSAIRSVYRDDESDIAVIDVGATSMKLYIVRNGLLQRMYRVRTGGVVVTEKISTDLSVPFEEAEHIKREIKPNDEKFSQVQKIHHSTYDRFLKEFKMVLDEYEKKLSVQVSDVYIIGGAAVFPGFDNYIGSIIGKKVNMPVPFNKVAYPAFMEDTLNDIGPTFTVALGAALRAFE